MPIPDKMGYAFTGTQKQDIIDHLKGINVIMNSIKPVQLSIEEHHNVSTIDNTRLPFVIQGEQLAQSYTALRPSFLLLADCTNDVKMTQDMKEIFNYLAETTDVLTDFSMCSENYAYKYMRELYENAKRAKGSNTPGVDTIIAALSPLFEKQGPSNSPVTPPVTPP